jgi:hypothetical protein
VIENKRFECEKEGEEPQRGGDAMQVKGLRRGECGRRRANIAKFTRTIDILSTHFIKAARSAEYKSSIVGQHPK